MRSIIIIGLLLWTSLLRASPGQLSKLLSTMDEGDTLKVNFSSVGCFHNTQYEFDFNPTTKLVTVKFIKDASPKMSFLKDKRQAELQLTTVDIARLGKLFDYLDVLDQQGGCSTENTIIIERLSKNVSISKISITDSSCGLASKLEILTFEEILERVQHASTSKK